MRQGALATLRLAPRLGQIFEIRNRFMCQLNASCRVRFSYLFRVLPALLKIIRWSAVDESRGRLQSSSHLTRIPAPILARHHLVAACDWTNRTPRAWRGWSTRALPCSSTPAARGSCVDRHGKCFFHRRYVRGGSQDQSQAVRAAIDIQDQASSAQNKLSARSPLAHISRVEPP